MDNLLSTIFPKAKTLSPAVIKSPEVTNVTQPNYLNRRLNFAMAPPHYKSNDPAYCTTLPPSPKDNIDNNPACVTGNKYPNRPFKRGKCYMLYSPQQNIWGPVCGDGGYNANWARGNRFGVDYQYKKIYNRPDYGVDVPKFIKKNPVLVSYSPFYPFPDYYVRYNPKYKSYPYVDKYIKGHPRIVYPYATLNKNAQTVVEGFCNKNSNVWIFFIIVVILFILFAK